MLQTNVREEYRITTLEVVELIEDLISYLAVAKCIRLRNAQIPKVFYKAAAGTIWTMMLAKVLDAVHHSVQKLEENYFEVIDTLTMTLIKDDDDLLGTVNSYIKLRRLRARRKTEAADSRYAKASRGRTKKDKDLEDSDTGSDVLRLCRRDRAAACARLAERKQLGKEAQLKKTRDEEKLAKAKKEKEEKEARERETYSLDIDSEDDLEDEEAMIAKNLAREQKERLKALLNAKMRDSLSARVETAMEYCTLEEWTSAAVFFGLTDAYILYFKELLSDNSGIFANAISIGKTRAIVLAVLIEYVYFKNWTEVQNARAEGNAIEYNAVNDDDKLCPTKSKRTFYCAWGRAADAWKNERSLLLIKANTPAVHSKATKHRLAPSAARFVIVCGFRKVDKHVFRAYNTISVTAQQTIIRKGSSYGRTVFDEFHNCKSEGIIMAKFYQDIRRVSNWFNATDKRDSVTGDRIYKIEDAQQCRDILEKEGLNELEASRRVIFNCFEMQAIASYSALATLKAAQFKTYSSCKVKRFTLNSVKDLFTNLSKDYFLVQEARAITKSSLNRIWSIAAEDVAKAANTLLLLKEVRAKILIGSYKLIVQARDLDRPWIIVALIAFAEAIILTEAMHVLAEMCVGIVYFNLDSELELKVLGKQDVKTTS
ncbi:hypothetical protein HBI80_094360 [Parastagonospora nodorum]|nr:hypothetical protein HBI80_094360 [Parastagonospora nodorum]